MMTKRIPFLLLCLFSLSSFADTQLRVWTGRLQPELALIAERFYHDTGVRIAIESPANMVQQFEIVAASGEGPDMIFWAHDRLGGWFDSGLIQAIDPPSSLIEKVNPVGWQGVSVNERYVAYPLLLEAVTLIYNRTLLDKPMQDVQQWSELDTLLKSRGAMAFAWEYSNPYYSWPFFASQGAKLFQPSPTQADEFLTRIATPESIEMGELLHQWIAQGLLPEGIGYGDMMRMFVKGKLAMMINGPWCWRNLRRNRVDFALAPLPAIYGQPAKPFVGVFAVAINRYSSHSMLAELFIQDYLLNAQGMAQLQSGGELGLPVLGALAPEHAAYLYPLQQSIEQGEPMPNRPEMARFWEAMNTALTNIGSQRQPAKHALRDAENRILDKPSR